MVRRWSHINLTNTEFFKFNKFEKKHKINVFKTSVNFKRFTFKLTKFRRKSMARFKHTSNWLIYTNVIKLWSRDYMFQKHLVKFQSLNSMFVNNFFVYNFNFVKLKNDTFSYNFNFFLSVLTKKTYFYYNPSKFPYFKNNNLTFIWTLDTPTIGNSVLVSYSEWDGSLYLPSTIKKDSIILDTVLESTFSAFSEISLYQSVEVRKIIIFLFLHNINFKALNKYVFRLIRDK